MEYSYFHERIDEYKRLWDKGLKKQANAVMKDLVKELSSLSSDAELDNLMIPFCAELFEREEPPLDTNTRGMLPFGFSELMERSLWRKCKESSLPWLRYYYVLYRSDPQNTKALSMLKRAVELDNVDQETIDLYFAKLLDWLWYGRHHFPEGCLYTREEYDELIKEGEDLIRRLPVKQEMVAAFDAHKKIYQCWDKWLEQNKEGDFAALCNENGIAFKTTGSYYY